MLALDMASTVPRKLDGLTRALAAHAPRGGGGDEAVTAAAAQVLRYYPNALRLDPATLAGKLEALRGAGLSSETVLSVVGGAPRCLSAAASTLEQRVSTLKEAFPSICVDGMLRQAPGLLQNRLNPGARVRRGGGRERGGGDGEGRYCTLRGRGFGWVYHEVPLGMRNRAVVVLRLLGIVLHTPFGIHDLRVTLCSTLSDLFGASSADVLVSCCFVFRRPKVTTVSNAATR